MLRYINSNISNCCYFTPTTCQVSCILVWLWKQLAYQNPGLLTPTLVFLRVSLSAFFPLFCVPLFFPCVNSGQVLGLKWEITSSRKLHLTSFLSVPFSISISFHSNTCLLWHNYWRYLSVGDSPQLGCEGSWGSELWLFFLIIEWQEVGNLASPWFSLLYSYCT